MKINNKIIGHNYLFQHLIELYQRNTLPNKILLSGKKGIGKFLFSNHFVNYILSQDEEYKYILKNFEVNSQNKSYLLFKKNTHPNIFLLTKNINNKYIEISQIREMIKFQYQSSFDNKIKSIIIDDLEYLNINSTNALLKSIEEPNRNVLFILINNSEKNITTTLKSRCIEFKLTLKYKDIEFIVNNYFDQEIYQYISLDFKNYYTSPSFLINLIDFFNNSSIDYKNFTIEDFLLYLIKNKSYSKNKFINENLNNFIELFFYKNINRSKKISYNIKEYFYTNLFQICKYNLDLETFFLEFEDQLLSE